MKKIGYLCLLLLLMVGNHAPVSRAQADQLDVTLDEISIQRYADEGIVEAYVTVRHPQEGSVEGLAAADFTLQVSDGALFTPDTVEVESARVSMAIVLELYTSMKGQPLEDAKSAISALCLDPETPPEDRQAIFGVRRAVDADAEALTPGYEMEFTEDGGYCHNFVTGPLTITTTGGGTPLYDVIMKAIRYTVKVSREGEGEPVGRRGVVVITDGGDVGSHNTSDVVIDAARQLRIPVYTIGYAGKNRQYDQFLNELANRTGGDYRNTPDSTAFEQFLSEVRSDLSQRYRLTFKAGPFTSSRQVLKVRVDKSGLTGSDSLNFDAPAEGAPAPTAAADGETPPAATTVPVDVTSGSETAPAATPAPTATPEAGKPDFITQLKDNPVLFGLIGGGALLLIVLLAFLFQRRKKSTQSSKAAAYTPPPPPAAQGTPVYTTPFEEPFPAAAGATGTVDNLAAGTQVGPSWSEPAPASSPWGPPPTLTPGTPPPPAAGGSGSKTEVLYRAPQMPHEAVLIERRTDAPHPVNRPTIAIGRAEGNDIKLDSERLSRKHAHIELRDDTFYVADDKSGNGTFVNDVRIYGLTPLRDGDRVRFADVEFTFKVVR